MRICCYCEKSVDQKEMTKIPPSGPRKAQWAAALGPRYQYLSEMKRHGFICLSHFERNKRGRRNVLSIPKPFLQEEENIPIDLNTINLYFLQHDHTYCKDLEKMPPLMRSQELANGNKQQCCYCEKSTYRQNMTRVPPADDDRRKEWSDILGPRFKYNIGLKINGYICRSHFDLDEQGKWKELPDPDPEQDIPQTFPTIPSYSIRHDHSYCRKSKYSMWHKDSWNDNGLK